jgi:hypothetical protein
VTPGALLRLARTDGDARPLFARVLRRCRRAGRRCVVVAVYGAEATYDRASGACVRGGDVARGYALATSERAAAPLAERVWRRLDAMATARRTAPTGDV